MKDNVIKTGVDSLVSLIQEEEKISVKKAAKKLSVPFSTVSEWASFLEEEGLINIEYRFTIPFLVKRKLSDEQLNQLKKKIKEEKDILDRKSESTLNYLNKLELEVESLKSIFSNIGQSCKKKLSGVTGELNSLRKAEEEKEKLNKKIIESKQKFMKQIADVNKNLLKEESNFKTIYNILYNQSTVERHILDIQEQELDIIKETDKILNKKLKEIRNKLDNAKKKDIKQKKKMTDDSESNLRYLEKQYSKIKDSIDYGNRVMQELMKENQEQEKQISELKEKVLSKIKIADIDVDKTLKELEELPKKLDLFMSKKDKVLKILDGIHYNEKMLKDKLTDLMKKSSALDISEDKVMDEIKKLEENLANIEKKRGFFEKQIKKIFNLLKL